MISEAVHIIYLATGNIYTNLIILVLNYLEVT